MSKPMNIKIMRITIIMFISTWSWSNLSKKKSVEREKKISRGNLDFEKFSYFENTNLMNIKKKHVKSGETNGQCYCILITLHKVYNNKRYWYLLTTLPNQLQFVLIFSTVNSYDQSHLLSNILPAAIVSIVGV